MKQHRVVPVLTDDDHNIRIRKSTLYRGALRVVALEEMGQVIELLYTPKAISASLRSSRVARTSYKIRQDITLLSTDALCPITPPRCGQRLLHPTLGGTPAERNRRD